MEHTLLLVFSFFTEAIVLWQYTSSLFIPKHSVYIRLTLLTVLYGILCLISFCRLSWLNISSFFLFNTAFLFTQFKLKLPVVCFYSAMLTAIMGISELVAFGIMSAFSPHFFSNSGVGLVFYTVFSKIFFFIIVYALTQLYRSKNMEQEHFDHSELYLILISAASIFIMFTFLTIGNTYPLIPPVSLMVTACAISLLMVNLLIFGLNQYNHKKNADFIDMQILLQKESDSTEYYEMLLSQNENQSILIHDIKKHLQSIQLLNEKNDSEKINAYIQHLMSSSNLKETSRICDHEMLNAILCRYQRQCNDHQISFHADIRSGSLGHIHQHDLTSLFCNLLDNALESAKNIPNGFIELTVQKKINSPFTVIIAINSCRNTPLYSPNGLPVSSKTDNKRHGFGMKSIQKVVKLYQGDLQMYYDNTSGTFHTIITIKQ